MNLPPTCANLLWAAANRPDSRRFCRALSNPAGTQGALLRRMLARHAASAYGRAHGFDTIGHYEEFARRVPLVDYEDLEPWIRRIRQGEDRVLTRDPVRHLIPTSGSAGARKLIPFTAGLQADFHHAIAPWMTCLFHQHPEIIRGPAYWSISPAARAEEELSAVPIGFDEDSAYLGGLRRRLVDSVLAAPSALRLVSDIETFRHLTLLCLLRRRNLRLISVWHPSFLGLLLDALPRHWDELLEDLRTGRCPRADALPARVRAAVRAGPLPRRARELQEHGDPQRPSTLWPFLRVISSWRDAHAESAAHALQQRFPGVILQGKGLVATEAIVTIPFRGIHPLAIRSHFFEFVDAGGSPRLAHELRDGDCYDVVVSTSGGLWRYRMHDRVTVTGFAGRTPSLRFLGRSGLVSDRFGEKLSEAFVGEAIRAATARLPEPPGFAMLAPERDAGGWRYILYLEGRGAPDVATSLATSLDCALRRNPNYAWCRDLGQLGEIRVEPVPPGGHESFMAREAKHGRRLGEIKPAALSARTGWTGWFQSGVDE